VSARLNRPRSLLLPPGLHWPRALLDADTAVTMKATRQLADMVRPGFAALTLGAPAVGLVKKVLAGLPEASAVHVCASAPLDDAEAAAELKAGGLAFPVLAGLPERRNGGMRLLLAPGMGFARADQRSLASWLAMAGNLMGEGDLLLFSLPSWADPAMLEARWSQANRDAQVLARPDHCLLQIAGIGLSHSPAAGPADALADAGLKRVTLVAGAGVLGVIAVRA
jgi:hypothetical protein